MALLRGWLIRGLILAALAGAVAVVWVAQDRVRPEHVRAALVEKLSAHLDGVDVHVGSARLRLFGGVTVTDLRLTRRGDAEPFLVSPAVVISHDKQTLSRGRVDILKVELDGPTVRLERRADGTWNVAGLAKEAPAGGPVPTVVIRNATVFLTDKRPRDPVPPVVVSNVRLTLLNDPVTALRADVQAVVAPAGPADGTPPPFSVAFAAAVRYDRATRQASARVEVPDLRFIPDLAPVVAKVCPLAGEYAAAFAGRLAVHADLSTSPEWEAPKYDVRLDVRDGRFEDPRLPWPVEQLAATVRARDGKLTVEKATAKLGKATAELALETRRLEQPNPPAPFPKREGGASGGTPVLPPLPLGEGVGGGVSELQDHLDRFDLTVTNLAVDDDLFARLPAKAGRVRAMFRPVGTVDVAARFHRTGPGWTREVEVRPNRLACRYERFPYPLEDLAGRVVKVTTHDGTDEFRAEVTAAAGGRRVELTGTVAGDGPDPLIRLRIAGTDIPIDGRLFAALPPKYGRAVGQLRATGRGDFVTDVRQDLGVNRCAIDVRVRVYDSAVNYAHFPYPLAGVKGNITVRIVSADKTRPVVPGGPPADAPDRVELHDFQAAHGAGTVWLSGRSEPVPGTRDRRLALRVYGRDCPVDADLRAALAAMRVDAMWRAFRPRGGLTFGMDVEVTDRDCPATADPPADLPFDPVADLKFTVNLKGPSVTPSFFPYPLDGLAGVVRYEGGKVDLARFSARHGPSRWALDAAEVRFAGGGGVWANLGRLSAAPFVPDAEYVAALPKKLRDGLTAMKPRGPMELLVHHMVVKVPGAGEPNPPPPFLKREGGASAATASRPLPLGEGVEEGVSPTAENAVIYWNGELRLAGAGLDAGVPWDDLHGVIASAGRYDGDHLGAVTGTAWLDRATVAKLPLADAKLGFRVRPQEPDATCKGGFTVPVVEFPDLAGTLHGGSVGGEARVSLDDTPRYRVRLTAADVKLEDLARGFKPGDGAELSGVAQGRVLLENAPDPATGELVLTGAGQVDVPAGRLLNLPVLIPLLKLFKLQAPDQTAFEEAHAVFAVRGDRVTVSQLDLVGAALSLGGSGELDAGGTDARFEFYTIWSQALKRWLTTPNGTDLAAALSGNLFRIEVVKRNGETKYKPHMLPAVTDPVRAVAERFRSRAAEPTARATIEK